MNTIAVPDIRDYKGAVTLLGKKDKETVFPDVVLKRVKDTVVVVYKGSTIVTYRSDNKGVVFIVKGMSDEKARVMNMLVPFGFFIWQEDGKWIVDYDDGKTVTSVPFKESVILFPGGKSKKGSK